MRVHGFFSPCGRFHCFHIISSVYVLQMRINGENLMVFKEINRKREGTLPLGRSPSGQ